MAAAACGVALATTQEVTIEAVDANGAAVSDAVCDIANRNGSWRIVTPAVARITPTGDWLAVKCAKGFDLAGSSTSIDTTQLTPRRSAEMMGGPRNLSGATVAAKVRVVMRNMTGALTGTARTHAAKPEIQTAQVAPLPSFATKAPEVREAPITPPSTIAATQGAILGDARPEVAHALAEPAVPARAIAITMPPALAEPQITIEQAQQPAREATPAPANAARVAAVADVYDIKAVPYLNESGRAAYLNFLNYPLARAFAISSTGGWGFGVRGLDPRKMALDNCERRGGPCEIYAVDRTLVWTAQP